MSSWLIYNWLIWSQLKLKQIYISATHNNLNFNNETKKKKTIQTRNFSQKQNYNHEQRLQPTEFIYSYAVLIILLAFVWKLCPTTCPTPNENEVTQTCRASHKSTQPTTGSHLNEKPLWAYHSYTKFSIRVHERATNEWAVFRIRIVETC